LDVPGKEALGNTMEVPVEGFGAGVRGILAEAICMDFLAGFNFNSFAIWREVRV
jgi:hypothetical protein